MKPKKSDLIVEFVDSINHSQQLKIQELLNRTVTRQTLTAFFTKVFKKTISIAARKSKARECQKEVAELISNLTGVSWGKDEEIASREMGQSGVDVRLSPRVQQMFIYDSECKDDASWNIKTAIKQAKANTKPGRQWAVFYKQTGRNAEDRVDLTVTIDARHFFDLLNELRMRPAPKLVRR